MKFFACHVTCMLTCDFHVDMKFFACQHAIFSDESSTNKQHHLSAENKLSTDNSKRRLKLDKLSTDNSKRRLKLAWWEQRTQWHYRHWKQLKKDLNFFGQWALCAAELTLARAGGGEDKKASCRDSMTLC